MTTLNSQCEYIHTYFGNLKIKYTIIKNWHRHRQNKTVK